MAGTFELVVQGEGVAPHAITLGSKPLSIGRAPSNDLVVSDGQVSWEHMKLWADAGRVWLSDLGSTNGTLLNEARIKGTVQVRAGDRIKAGTLNLELRQNGVVKPPPPGRAIAIEEVRSGLKHQLRGGRFTIGSSPDADLRLPTGPLFVAEFATHADGDFWLLLGNEDYPLELGEEIEIAQMTFRLVEVPPQRQPTIQAITDRFPYELKAKLDGPTGPFAHFTNTRTGEECLIEAETRAVLLFLLGRKHGLHKASGVPREDRGWCPDDEVIIGVWGRSGVADGTNRLKVLVHRLRAELKKSNFDPWLIERRRRFIRVRIREFLP